MHKDFLLKDEIGELQDIAAERNDEPEGLAGSKPSLRIVHANLSNSLQIKTSLDGLNSGKTFYLSTRGSTNPDQTRQSVVSQLRTLSTTARRKAEAKSRFQKSQEKVQIVQGSLAFQLFMALLIMVVILPSLIFSGEYIALQSNSVEMPRADADSSCLLAELLGERDGGADRRRPDRQRGPLDPARGPTRAARHLLHHRLHHRDPHQRIRPLVYVSTRSASRHPCPLNLGLLPLLATAPPTPMQA
jgi:hypothetical protein